MCVLALCACVRLCTHTRRPAPVAQVYALPDLTMLPYCALGDEVEMLNEEAAQATQATECSYEGPTKRAGGQAVGKHRCELHATARP